MDRHGAEGFLINLAKGSTHLHQIVSLKNAGGYLKEKGDIDACEIRILEFGNGALKNFLSLLKLIRICYRFKPDVLSTWLYQSDVVGCILKTFYPKAKLVWNIRRATWKQHRYLLSRSSNIILTLLKFFSWFLPTAIICNSKKGLESHVGLGYCARKICVIPNGIDTKKFKRDNRAGLEFREFLGVSSDKKLIGLVARFDPVKDHRLFLNVAKQLSAGGDGYHFLLCGTNINWDNFVLCKEIESDGLSNLVHLVDERTDLVPVYSALDLHLMTSISEGWPNVLAEALSVEVLCVSTNVGAAAEILGESGFCVNSRNPVVIASVIQELFKDSADELRSRRWAGRQYIEKCFSVEKIIRDFDVMYQSL